MKKTEAIIKLTEPKKVKTALTGLNNQGMIKGEIKGFGRQRGHTEIYRGSEYSVNFVPN